MDGLKDIKNHPTDPKHPQGEQASLYQSIPSSFDTLENKIPHGQEEAQDMREQIALML